MGRRRGGGFIEGSLHGCFSLGVERGREDDLCGWEIPAILFWCWGIAVFMEVEVDDFFVS